MNSKNPAIKRIQADVRELAKHPSSRYFAAPLEENMFEWHFTIRGPAGTEFEGGMYHGRILLSPDYPFKPPNIVFTTRNGRFEVGTKICLSISAYHEESWQPAWGVRTMLEAIISFMPSEGGGAIGALDWSADERRRLAKESVQCVCSVCGPIRQLLSDVKGSQSDEPAADIVAQIRQLRFQPATTGDTSEAAVKTRDDVSPAPELLPRISTLPSESTSDKALPAVNGKELQYDAPQATDTTSPASMLNVETPPVQLSVRKRVLTERQHYSASGASNSTAAAEGDLVAPDRSVARSASTAVNTDVTTREEIVRGTTAAPIAHVRTPVPSADSAEQLLLALTLLMGAVVLALACSQWVLLLGLGDESGGSGAGGGH